MAVRKIKGSWWVDFSYKFERMRRRSPLNTKAGAQEFEVFLRQHVVAHGSVEASLAAMESKHTMQLPTFEVFVERWFREYVVTNNKPSEQGAKRKVLVAHLLPFFGNLRLAAITGQKIEQYKGTKLRNGLSAKTINNHLTVLRKCLTVAVEWTLLSAVPLFKFLKTIPPRFRFLSSSEMDSLVRTATPGLWRTMILTASKTGLRVSELLALEWQDVDLAGRMLCVRQADVYGHVGATKSNRIRYVPLTDDVVAELGRLKDGHELVFHRNGRRLKYDVAHEHLVKTCVRANLRPVGWHALRHSFASQLVSNGAPLKAVQELMGHSTIEMTMRYTHLALGFLRSAIDLLEPAPAESMATWRQPESKLSPLTVGAPAVTEPVFRFDQRNPSRVA